MTRAQTNSIDIAWRIAAAALCAAGIWSSLCLARADFLFRQNTEQSVQAAVRLEPDAWQYDMRLSLLDDAHAERFLETARTLDVYNSEADIELGLRREAAGDYPTAERLLLDAYAVDDTYLPRWSLANFYLRRGSLPEFWAWARSAAQMPSDNTGPLFELCWSVSPDPNEITQKILNDNPRLIRQYLDFLLTKNQALAAAGMAGRLIQTGESSSDNPKVFLVIDQLLKSNDGDAARSLWNVLIARKWIVADKTIPNNPDFARDPLPVGLDWSLPSLSGLHSWPGPSGLESEFSGEEPESCTVAEQEMVLSPGNYQMDFSYRTQDIPAATGLRWQVVATSPEKLLAESPDLSSDSMSNVAVPFSIRSDVSLVSLRLQYQRALGTPRISGTLVVPSIHISARK